MKKFSCLFIIFVLLFVLCSCSEEHINDANSGVDERTIDVTLGADDHAELDFGYMNGERAIKDFIVDGAEIYILQYDSTVLRYDKNGKFTEKYDLDLAEQGLTASRIAYSNGKIYLLDGHNNAIITAEKDKVKNVSVLNFSDVGMVKNFYAQKNGTLIMSFSDIDEAYTVEIDPNGMETEIVGEKQKGYLIGGKITYLPELINNNDETSQVKVTIYRSGEKIRDFSIGTVEKSRSMQGLSIYGVSNDEWFGILHEFVNYGEDPSDEKYIKTSVSIDTKNEKIKTSDKYFDDDAIIKLSKDDTYCMSFLNNALTIKPISEYFSDWSDSDIYFLTND